MFPVLGELSDEPGSAVRALPPIEGVEVGIIAAAADRRVRLPDPHVDGESDHVVLPGAHGPVMLRADTCRQTAHFLRRGRFERRAPAECGQPAAEAFPGPKGSYLPRFSIGMYLRTDGPW